MVGVHSTYMRGLERGERSLTLKSVERLAEKIGVRPLEHWKGRLRPADHGAARMYA